MAPPSQKPAGAQATISAFFKPKPSSSSSSNGASSSAARPPSEPPFKKPRLAVSEAPRRETLARMDRWRFEKDTSTTTTTTTTEPDPTVKPESSQANSDRSSEADARHRAFRKKLLGSDFAVDRHARNQMQIERMSAADTPTSEDALDAPGSADNAIVLEDDDVDDTTEAADPPSNRFDRFAAVEGSSSTANKPSSSRAKGKGSASLDPSGPTYTPLEKQILELKAAHPGVLLVIEVGYKLKFYGEDARIASKELNIMCFPERNLLTAMIPVHRLHIHVKRLIQAGHKVGVVRQIETRALKAASKNAYTPFVRKLTALYTASTWIDDLASSDDVNFATGAAHTYQPKSLMALVEQSEGGNGPEDRVAIGLISVEVNTGYLTYDQFSDSHARTELETRIAHLAPAELLVPQELTRPTEKVIGYLLGSGAEGGVRIERVASKLDYNQAFQSVTQFYRDRASGDSDGTDVEMDVDAQDKRPAELMSLIQSLPHLALIALAQIIHHLQAFNLESICTLSTNFQSFSSRTTMLLNSNTLANLEIFRTVDGHEKGSLIWLLDKCRTSMGRRLLRKWVSRPLTDVDALERRLDAIEAIISAKSYVVRMLPNFLQGLPDLERGLARMTYGRATPTELATVLLSLNRVTQEVRPAERDTWKLDSSLVEEHLLNLAAGKTAVQTYLNQISIKEARANNKADLFADAERYPAIQTAKDNIAIVETELREHLRELRKTLHRPSLEYASVSGVEYLVEVRVADAKKVPADWLRVSATKAMVRFHTPEVIRLTRLRDQHKETLAAAAESAFSDFVRAMCTTEYVVLRNVVTSLAVLDVLVSLAELAASSGYTRPRFERSSPRDGESGVRVEVKAMRHAILEVVSPLPYIPNDLVLSDDTSRAVLLTGCNMGGKSSVVRTLGLLVVLAQIGSYVPAAEAKLGVHDGVFVRMGARDAMFAGRSTFMVEVAETAEILRAVTPRSLVILDELGRGTSTHDGVCIAWGVLEYLLQLKSMPNVVFITHYLQLAELVRRYGARNMHMAYVQRDGIQFLYTLKQGATASFGIHCAKLAQLPSEITHTAEAVAQRMQADHETRVQAAAAKKVLKSVFAGELGVEAVKAVRDAVARRQPYDA